MSKNNDTSNIWADVTLKLENGVPTITVTALLPPSDNHIYFVAGRRLVKTKFAEAYSRHIKTAIGKKALSNVVFDKNKPHGAYIQIFFPRLFTSGFPKTAKNRFFRCDTDNRKKLLIDSVCAAIGIDDACITYAINGKHQDKKNPRVELCIRELVYNTPQEK